MSLATPVGSQENTGPKEWKHIRPIEINAYKLWWVFNEMDLGNLCRCFDSRRPKGEQQCPKCAHWPEAANLRSCWEKTPEGWTNCRRCHEYWKEESIKRAKEDSPSNTLRAHLVPRLTLLIQPHQARLKRFRIELKSFRSNLNRGLPHR